MPRRGLLSAQLAAGGSRRRQRRIRRPGGPARRPSALSALRRRPERRTPLHGARRLPSLALPLRRASADLQTGTTALFCSPPSQSSARPRASGGYSLKPVHPLPSPARFQREDARTDSFLAASVPESAPGKRGTYHPSFHTAGCATRYGCEHALKTLRERIDPPSVRQRKQARALFRGGQFIPRKRGTPHVSQY